MTTDIPAPKPTKKQLTEHLEYMDQLRRYELSDGSVVMLPVDLAQGDLVAFRPAARKQGLFGRQQPGAAFHGQVMDAGVSLESRIARGAFDAVSAILKDPRCRGVGVTSDNQLVVSLDLSLYASLKETVGLGQTALPLKHGEHFRHEAFTFVVAGATDHQRGIGHA